MKTFFPFFTFFLLLSLGITTFASRKEVGKVPKQEIVKPELQQILDSANVKGSILIYDIGENKYYSNNFGWARKGQLPASTFKIPNSIIALETEVIENEHTVFPWNGEKRTLKAWEQDLSLKNAFQYSCVPCYQNVARQIGVKRMKEYLEKLKFGSIKVDSATIDMFWLQGASKINQFQQINFLNRFYESKLPISKKTEGIIKKILLLEENEKFKISGKTGWSVQNEVNNGWFVGYVESGDKVFYFATNVEPHKDFNMELFPEIRKGITFVALENLKIIE